MRMHALNNINLHVNNCLHACVCMHARCCSFCCCCKSCNGRPLPTLFLSFLPFLSLLFSPLSLNLPLSIYVYIYISFYLLVYSMYACVFTCMHACRQAGMHVLWGLISAFLVFLCISLFILPSMPQQRMPFLSCCCLVQQEVLSLLLPSAAALLLTFPLIQI